MKTYEELIEVGDSDEKRGEFCAAAVRALESESDYQMGLVANEYYECRNVTIQNFTKWLYTITGNRIKDIYSANYKLKTKFFRNGVVQHANYLLGKGVIFEDSAIKDKLGKNFDHELIKMVKMAMVEGRSFGYWNDTHLEAFGYCCTDKHAGFCPLYDEDTGKLMAGIRFWRTKVGNKSKSRYTLFEPDGITEYVKDSKSATVRVLEQKKKYRTVKKHTPAEGVYYSENANYEDNALPIVQTYASDLQASDLVLIRDEIDCMDLIKSGLADVIDDNSEIIWLFLNSGGMTDPAIAKMLHRIRTMRGAAVDSEDGGNIIPHTVDVPHEARDSLLDRLRADMHEDFMLMDRKPFSAAQKTQMEIEMAYQGQDDYTDELEFHVMQTLDALLAIAGVDADYHFERSRVGNRTEITNMVLAAAPNLSQECVIRHLPFLTPEEMDEEIENLAKENMGRFQRTEEAEEDDEEE